MAVFMLNACKFKDCGLIFKSLGQLIEHVENTHIDFSPHVIQQLEEQKPAYVPLSYILRFSNLGSTKDNVQSLQETNLSHASHSSTNVKSSSTGSEGVATEDISTDLEDSNDSCAKSEEYPSDIIFRNTVRVPNQSNAVNLNNPSILDKPFACPVPGCKKRYKNINGIRYHTKNGHKNNDKVLKSFICACGKSYKTMHSLKNHSATQHGQMPFPMQPTPKPTSKTDFKEFEFEEISRTVIKPYRPKVAAIEDHGYMKTDQLDINCDFAFDILTPASSPIKVDPTSHVYNYTKYLGVPSS